MMDEVNQYKKHAADRRIKPCRKARSANERSEICPGFGVSPTSKTNNNDRKGNCCEVWKGYSFPLLACLPKGGFSLQKK